MSARCLAEFVGGPLDGDRLWLPSEVPVYEIAGYHEPLAWTEPENIPTVAHISRGCYERRVPTMYSRPTPGYCLYDWKGWT